MIKGIFDDLEIIKKIGVVVIQHQNFLHSVRALFSILRNIATSVA